MRRLDIINYFIENVNFQKIKSLLFTKEQYYLFNCPNKICWGLGCLLHQEIFFLISL